MLATCVAAGPALVLPPMKARTDRLPDVPAAVMPRQSRGAGNANRAEVVSYSDDRRTRGLRALGEITGATGEDVIAGLRDIAPDLADWIVDFSYGDVMARPGLDRRTRQLATIAALAAMGNARPQLLVHIKGAINVGCRPAEIIEVIMQMAVFAGFPAAINALDVAREAFASTTRP
jgi:4-carboxymuconolactone decarboxylase